MKSLFKDNVVLEAGIVLEVGSGSAGVAILVSDSTQASPVVVWSLREYLPDTKDINETKRRLPETVSHVLSELNAAGLSQLKKAYPTLHPKLIQVTFSAPFSYTTARKVSVQSPEPFLVSKKTVRELEIKAKQVVQKEAPTKMVENKFKLIPLADSTVALTLNGYQTFEPFGNETREVCLSQLSSLADQELVSAVRASLHRFLPECRLDLDSFMILYFRALDQLIPSFKDACLVSITANATEIMLVKDGLPLSSHYIEFGHHNLAKAGPRVETNLISSEEYETKLTALFQEAGDALSIPRRIYLHAEKTLEPFFIDRVKNAVQKATGLTHELHAVTSEFFGANGAEDTAILCSAYVFHHKLYLDTPRGE